MAQNLDPLWTSFEQKPQWLICFCDRNNYRRAEKLLQKRKHCKKQRFLALCLEEVVLREENYR